MDSQVVADTLTAAVRPTVASVLRAGTSGSPAQSRRVGVQLDEGQMHTRHLRSRQHRQASGS